MGRACRGRKKRHDDYMTGPESSAETEPWTSNAAGGGRRGGRRGKREDVLL